MSTTVTEVNAAIEQLWPTSEAQSWDAPGFLVGDPSAIVRSVLVAVDAVSETVDEAVSLDADLLLVHHPLLLRGVTTVAEDRYKGALISRLIKADCALVAAHTNADIVETGTSAVLAARIGLQDVTPIVPSANPAQGIGRAGRLTEPTTLGRLARRLAGMLPATATGVRVSGDFARPIERVALCGGAGDSLLGADAVLAADVYITSDLRHHPASEFRENSRVAGGPALIDISHWASEWLWLSTAAGQLAAALPDVAITVSELRTDPWDFTVVQ